MFLKKILIENGIPIESWYEDKNDNCLQELIPMFEQMRWEKSELKIFLSVKTTLVLLKFKKL